VVFKESNMEKRGRKEVRSFYLRLSVDVGKKLEQEALKSGRSVNAEMEYRIAQSLGIDLVAQDEQNRATLEAMAADIKTLRQIAEAFAKGETHVYTVAT